MILAATELRILGLPKACSPLIGRGVATIN
jgi:hypothetical protein